VLRRDSLIRRPAFQVFAFIALATAVKVAASLLQEPDAIEAYHWLYARHLAAGYYDHPGMIGWLIWLSTSVFGDSLFAIRLPTIVGSGLAVWLTFLAGRRMYDEKAGRLAALLVGLVPLTARFAMEATPDGPLLLFWTASIWALGNALSKDRVGWWVASGAFMGAAMDSKYTAVLLPAGLILFLAFSPDHRKRLGRFGPYLAAIVALAVFWPTLVWNAQHEWQSFAYQGVERMKDSQELNLSRLEIFVRRQASLVTPFVLAWAVATGVRIPARWKSAPWTDRLNACLGAPILFLFLAVAMFRTVRAHWPVPAYVSLFLMSAAAVERGGPWGKRLHYGTLAILAAGGVVWPAYLATVPTHRVEAWERAAAEVRRHDPAFVIAPDYHHAALLSWRLDPVTAWDMTPTGRGGKSFRQWWRPEEFAGKDAVVVMSKPPHPADLASVQACFERVEGPFEFEVHPLGDDRESLQVWVARTYRPKSTGPVARNSPRP
jgi:4-amino-4-deoxy-L-arabinose transferase-like glycosyltransferase